MFATVPYIFVTDKYRQSKACAMVLVGLGIAKTDKLLHAIPLSFVGTFPACSIFLLGWVFPSLALPTSFVSLPVDYPVRSKWTGLSLTRDVCRGLSKLCYLLSWWRQSLRQRESLISKATDSYRLRHLTVHVSNLLKNRCLPCPILTSKQEGLITLLLCNPLLL